MLILSRKQDEVIIITTPDGVRISILVADIRGEKVRIGIDAPDRCKIHRQEVQDQIDAGMEMPKR